MKKKKESIILSTIFRKSDKDVFQQKIQMIQYNVVNYYVLVVCQYYTKMKWSLISLCYIDKLSFVGKHQRNIYKSLASKGRHFRLPFKIFVQNWRRCRLLRGCRLYRLLTIHRTRACSSGAARGPRTRRGGSS